MRLTGLIGIGMAALLAGCGESPGGGAGASDSASGADAAKFAPHPCDRKEAELDALVWTASTKNGRPVVLSNTFDASTRRRTIVFDLDAAEAQVGEPSLREWAWAFDCAAPDSERAQRIAFQAIGGDGRTLEFDRAALDRIEREGKPDALAGLEPTTVMPASGEQSTSSPPSSGAQASASAQASSEQPVAAVPTSGDQPVAPASGEQPAD